MEKKETKDRIEKLRETINHHRYLYHVLDRQEISDTALDSLKRELREMEEKHPEFLTADSPTQRVGGKPLDKFRKIKHKIRQWSFDDVFSEEGIKDFDHRVKRALEKELGKVPEISYTAELKIDGFKIILTYKKGLLFSAATRGDGVTGEDVTQNVKTIESIPLRLAKEVDAVVEGEIWMGRKEFEAANKERERLGEALFANPRNVAAGSIRQLDPKIAASRKLNSFVYDLPFITGHDIKIPKTQYEEIKFLRGVGFKTNPNIKLCDNVDGVIAFWSEWSKKRSKEEYWIDGVAVKVNEIYYQNLLGYTGKAPRFAIAFKFPTEQSTTKIEDIVVQVGRTGVLTPVAHLTPVLILGSTVTRATLHNEEEIKRLDAKIGDTVIIQKAGDVIPEIVQVLDEMRTGKERKFIMPKLCPVCGSKTMKDPDGPLIKCLNVKCPSRRRRGLYYFVSKRAFNIVGMGPKIIDAILDNSLIQDAADIFDLREGDLIPIERFAEKSAKNLVSGIEARREIPFERFVVALGMLHVGDETAEGLAGHFPTIEGLKSATLEELEAIPNIGGVVAGSIHDWFLDKGNKIFLEKLLSRVSIVYEKKKNGGRFQGKSFILTGTLDGMSREEARRRVKALGGDVHESVSKNTSYVVIGKNPGSKYDRAKSLGVKILNEREFLSLLKK